MAGIVFLLILIISILLQNSIVNQVSMLYGSADIMLLVLLSWMLHAEERQHWLWGIVAGLFVGISSALPFWLPVIGYSVIVGLVYLLQRLVWQVPIWLLLTSTVLGTVLIYGFEMLYLWVIGTPFAFGTVFNLLILPSVVLNLILIFPVYGFIGEVEKMLYPEKVEV